jgi:hypothetical protein
MEDVNNPIIKKGKIRTTNVKTSIRPIAVKART